MWYGLSVLHDDNGKIGSEAGPTRSWNKRGELGRILSLLRSYPTPFWFISGLRASESRNPPGDVCMLQGTIMGLNGTESLFGSVTWGGAVETTRLPKDVYILILMVTILNN